MDVIKRLRDMMAERQWSEYRLAKEAHLSQSTIANIFHRNTIPSIPTLKSICDAFGISLCQFFQENTTVISSSQMELLNDWEKLTAEQKTLLQGVMKELQKQPQHKDHAVVIVLFGRQRRNVKEIRIPTSLRPSE